MVCVQPSAQLSAKLTKKLVQEEMIKLDVHCLTHVCQILLEQMELYVHLCALFHV